jgi:hypothetical protein
MYIISTHDASSLIFPFYFCMFLHHFLALLSSSLYIFYTISVYDIFPISSSEFHMFYKFCAWDLLQYLLNSVNVLYSSYIWSLIFSLLNSVCVLCYFCACISLIFFSPIYMRFILFPCIPYFLFLILWESYFISVYISYFPH